MTVDDLLKLHEATCLKGQEIMRMKNSDYTAGSNDPFANFRACEFLGVPGVVGILMRITDKMQRVKTFVQNGTLMVKAESVDDALVDMINYSILALGMITEERDRIARETCCSSLSQSGTPSDSLPRSTGLVA